MSPDPRGGAGGRPPATASCGGSVPVLLVVLVVWAR